MSEAHTDDSAADTRLHYAKPELLRLKNHPDFNEKWLQDRIAEDPGILGLGELVLIERERRQDARIMRGGWTCSLPTPKQMPDTKSN